VTGVDAAATVVGRGKIVRCACGVAVGGIVGDPTSTGASAVCVPIAVRGGVLIAITLAAMVVPVGGVVVLVAVDGRGVASGVTVNAVDEAGGVSVSVRVCCGDGRGMAASVAVAVAVSVAVPVATVGL